MLYKCECGHPTSHRASPPAICSWCGKRDKFSEVEEKPVAQTTAPAAKPPKNDDGYEPPTHKDHALF